MTRRFSSISTQTTLATSISNSALSLVVATGTASTLLGGITLTAGNVDQFKIIIDPDTVSREICYVTEVTSDTLTIQRGKDGTSAVSHTGGAVIKHVLTGEDLTYFTTGVVPTSNLAVGLPFPGSTSGTNTLKAPAVTGTVTNTLPATTGTLISAESIDAATSKATPVDADELALSDSAASFGLKKLTWANLKATLKTYFDTLYQATGLATLKSTLTTTGDIYYASSASTPARLGIGTSAQVLTVAGGVPSWATPNNPNNKVVQIVNFQTGTLATGTTVLPNDGTIPQNTEGTQFMTLAITPTSATNILDIQVVVRASHSLGNTDVGTALFQDTTAGALAATGLRQTGTGVPTFNVLTYRMVAGTTSSTTFKVRVGSADAGTLTFCPDQYGQIPSSSITITESTP